MTSRSIAAVVACILFAALAAGLTWNLPAVMDEADYVQAMANWAGLGLPIFDHGRDDPARHARPVPVGAFHRGAHAFTAYSDPAAGGNDIAYLVRDDGEWMSYGLWHPPLEVGIGALLERAGARGTGAKRLMSVAFALAALIVTARFASLSGGRHAPIAVAIGALACPPLLWGAGLIDVHSGLGSLTVAIWIALASVDPEERTTRRAIAMSGALAGVFASALGLGAACAAAFLLVAALRALVARSAIPLLHAALVCVGAALLLTAAYGATAVAFHLPWQCTFQHNLLTAGSRGASRLESSGTFGIVRHVARVALDLNPVLIAAAVIGAARTVRREAARALSHPLALASLTLAALMVGYGVVGAGAYGFPKYVISAGLLAALIAGAGISALAEHTRGRGLALAALLLALGFGAAALTREIARHGRHPYESDVAAMPAAAAALASAPIAQGDALICDKDVAMLARRSFVEAFGPGLEDPPRIAAVRNARRVWLLVGPQPWRETAPIARRADFHPVWSRGKYVLEVSGPRAK